MAGSLSWRRYDSDAGVSYAIKMDESNANATQGTGGVLCAVPTATHPRLPQGVAKRYILCQAIGNPSIRRKFYVGSTTRFAALQAAASTPISGPDYPTSLDATGGTAIQWQISYFKGEISKLPAAFNATDTGLTDGTVSQ